MGIRLLVGNFTEVVLPYFKIRASQKESRNRGDDDSEYEDPYDTERMRKRQRSPAEEQFELNHYDALIGTFNDYAELVIQFGYATLFVASFPLAPLMALVNNYVEIRIDGWKLCQNSRRPIPSGAEDIGTWQAILEIMSIASVICNCALIAYTGDFLKRQWLMSTRVFIFIFLEHLLFFAKSFFALVVDDVPDEVNLQIERQEFMKKKIIGNAVDEDIEGPGDEDDDDLDVPEILEQDEESLPKSKK